MIQVIRGAMRPILGTLNRIGVYGVILVHQILFRTRPLGVLPGDLWAFGGFLYTCLYNNAAKIFGTEGILCRKIACD